MSTYEDRILRAMRRMTRAIDLHSRRLASEAGLTVPQLVCLRAIHNDEREVTPSRLAEEVHLSRATITGILDRLSKRDLVVRERTNPDRRVVTLHLTEAGSELLDQAPSPLHSQLARRLSGLPPDKQSEIYEVLEEVVRMMEAEGLDAAPLLATGPVDATPAAIEEFLES